MLGPARLARPVTVLPLWLDGVGGVYTKPTLRGENAIETEENGSGWIFWDCLGEGGVYGSALAFDFPFSDLGMREDKKEDDLDLGSEVAAAASTIVGGRVKVMDIADGGGEKLYGFESRLVGYSDLVIELVGG